MICGGEKMGETFALREYVGLYFAFLSGLGDSAILL